MYSTSEASDLQELVVITFNPRMQLKIVLTAPATMPERGEEVQVVAKRAKFRKSGRRGVL